ncbi:hypothetical protein MFIFM68171_07194 [Madurella fahalii]|uniref:Uncharacterized protein n=1 Tax=Madurella fahalii TaxID=1157608 RepID=A0ABQ0GGW7_9PEZI
MATTSYLLSQLTPDPSCGIGTALWAVSKTCYMSASYPTPVVEINPPWMSCTAVQAGEPYDKLNNACYGGLGRTRIGDDYIPIFYSACPVGYTAASSYTHPAFYRTFTISSGTETTTRAEATDVVATHFFCCPSASGFHYEYLTTEEPEITTVHDGTTFSGRAYLMQRCRATRVAALSGQTVTLTPYSDTLGWERRRRQEETGAQQDPGPLITEAWDDAKNVYAADEYYDVTVFADGHSCYTNCSDYWLSSYTSPVNPQTTITTAPATITEDAGGGGTASAGLSRVGEGAAAPTSTVTSGVHRVGLGAGWARAGALLASAAVAASLVI